MKTPSLLSAILASIVSVALLGCTVSAPPADSSGTGGGDTGGGDTGGGDTGGGDTGGGGAGGGGGESVGCDDCAADEQCITCNTAGPPSKGCVATKEPAANEFACKWTACAVGTICLDIHPAGDGCPDAQCAAVPDECESDPTCNCVSKAFNGVMSCSEDEDGNVTVMKYPY